MEGECKMVQTTFFDSTNNPFPFTHYSMTRQTGWTRWNSNSQSMMPTKNLIFDISLSRVCCITKQHNNQLQCCIVEI